MTNERFNLLKKRYPEDATDPEHKKIKKLRATARDYRDTHNALVQQLWDVEQNLVISNSEDEKKVFLQEKDELLNKIESKGYIKKINALLEEIKVLEIAVDGFSAIDGNSPYEL